MKTATLAESWEVWNVEASRMWGHQPSSSRKRTATRDPRPGMFRNFKGLCSCKNLGKQQQTN
jgi:hypothetical protein